tara:strand:+ start:43 stop:366 length:324 start_codon:yes stop_codon:yes gene_type:complete
MSFNLITKFFEFNASESLSDKRFKIKQELEIQVNPKKTTKVLKLKILIHTTSISLFNLARNMPTRTITQTAKYKDGLKIKNISSLEAITLWIEWFFKNDFIILSVKF